MTWSLKSPDFGFLAKNQSLETLDSVFTKKLITYFRTITHYLCPPSALPLSFPPEGEERGNSVYFREMLIVGTQA